MKSKIGNYNVEKLEDGNLRIDYSKSLKDYYLILFYSGLSLPLIYFSYKLFGYIQVQKESTDVVETVLRYAFAAALLIAGFYFMSISFESLVKPGKKVFFVDKAKKQLTIKKSIFKSDLFNFSEIRSFEIGAKDITVATYHDGRAYKRQLFIIELALLLKDNKLLKVHQFDKPNVLISFNEKEINKSLKEVSKQITNLLSKECNIEINWKRTLKE